MKQENIKFDILNQAPEVAIGNLEAGKIDAFCYWPPYIEMAKYKNIGRILPPGHMKKYEPNVNAYWTIMASENFAKKNPTILKGIIKAYLDIHKFVREKPDEPAQIVFKELEEKTPLQVLKASLASYAYADRFDQEHIDVMQRDIDFFFSKGFVKKEIALYRGAPEEVRALRERLAALDEEIAKAMLRWEELESRSAGLG